MNFVGNFVSFMDTMLQFGILGIKTRELYLPTRLQRVVIDPLKQKKMSDSLSEGQSTYFLLFLAFFKLIRKSLGNLGNYRIRSFILDPKNL